MIKMEEQTVPSAGFSPQPDPYDSEYMAKFASHQQPNFGSLVGEDTTNYCNLADTFDLSLLGDYEDHDLATVPSPSGWMPGAHFEASSWQQVSLYASSPSTEYRAFSPDCKPALSPLHPFNNDGGYNSPSMASNPNCLSPTPLNNQQYCGGMNNVKVLSPDQQQGGMCDRNLLLRQCLEDTTFQRKYNFKPLDLPSANILENEPTTIREIGGSQQAGEGGNGSNFELNQIEPVFNMAFDHIRGEIQASCNTLGISPDPMQWSGSDVRSWLAHTLSSLPIMSGTGSFSDMAGFIQHFWNMDGRAMCAFTEEEFRRLDALMGNHVYNTLELWKTLQPKSGSSQLPSTGSEVSFPTSPANSATSKNNNNSGNNNNSSPTFDLEQLLLPTTELTSVEGKNSTVPDVSNLETVTSPSSFSSSSSTVEAEPMNTDDDEEEDEDEDEKKPVGKKGTNGGKSGAHIHLWQFLKFLLASPQQHGSCIRWLDQSRGVFKIEDSVRVARLWGLRKNRPAMNYDKLSRSIRQYYRKGIMKKTERSQRLVYQFCHPYGL